VKAWCPLKGLALTEIRGNVAFVHWTSVRADLFVELLREQRVLRPRAARQREEIFCR
jgi:hypothetical protein